MDKGTLRRGFIAPRSASQAAEIDDLAERAALLQTELQQRDAKIKELTAELTEAQDLATRQREHVEDCDQLIEQWIDVFEMQQNDRGDWVFDRVQSELWGKHVALLQEHQKLIRQWNRFVAEYNARISPRERGRPIAASAAQQTAVVKRHKTGESLRTIAAATSLSLRTVQTIVDKAKGRGPTSKRTNEVRRKEFDRLRAASFRARKVARDRLPQAIGEYLEAGAALAKAAKGIGR